MNTVGNPSPIAAISPVRVFLLMMLVVFAVEGAIMIALPLLPGWARSPLTQGLIDASLLTLVTAPAMWWLAVRPIQQLFEARGNLLHQLFHVQDRERARIARDLHDEIGQYLTALLVGLRTIESCENLDAAKTRAEQLRELASDAHQEVGRMARGLRPGVLDELRLKAAIEHLCDEFQAIHEIPINVELKGNIDETVQSDIETAVYRVLQEALTNIARHANATSVDVLLKRIGDRIVLRIADNGRGFSPLQAVRGPAEEGRIGLASIRERAILLGGECRISSEYGEGTIVEASIPVAKTKA